jgi:hypothetical protein
VARDQTFTADLERLEPGTRHINAGIPGTAPDAYLLVLRQWLAAEPVDLAVMYIFEGNDLQGLDDNYPCCNWQSILTYGTDGPVLRCPTASSVDLAAAGATWLRYNSPPPYLIRALIGPSVAAAHIGAAIQRAMLAMPVLAFPSQDMALEHLESILRAARDELRSRRTPFVVVVLPARDSVEDPAAAGRAVPAILAVARRLDVPALDATEVVRQGAARGERMFFDNPSDPHFTATAHEIVARWLHDQLPAATERARAANDRPAG